MGCGGGGAFDFVLRAAALGVVLAPDRMRPPRMLSEDANDVVRMGAAIAATAIVQVFVLELPACV